VDNWVIFSFGLIVNEATINFNIHVGMCFHSLGQIPSSGMAELYDRHMPNFKRNIQTIFQNWLYHFTFM
jgi:hypothetical protein